jgi:hypothetical protein
VDSPDGAPQHGSWLRVRIAAALGMGDDNNRSATNWDGRAMLGPLRQGMHDHRTSHRCGRPNKERRKTLLDPRQNAFV